MNPLGIMSLVYPGSMEERARRIVADGLDHVIVHAAEVLDLAPEYDHTAHAFREAGLDADGVPTAGTVTPEAIDDELCRRAVAPFRDAGLHIACLGGYINPMHPDPAERSRQRELFYALIRHCRAFGTRYVATETGSVNPESQWLDHPDNHTPQAWAEMREFVIRCVELAEEHDVVVLIEGYVENVLSTLEEAERLRREVSSKALGFVLDPNNFVHEADLEDMEGYLSRFFDIVAPYAPVAHAKDVIYVDGKIRTPKAGSGRMNYPMFCELLSKVQPDAPLIMEHLQAQDVPEVSRFIRSHWGSR